MQFQCLSNPLTIAQRSKAKKYKSQRAVLKSEGNYLQQSIVFPRWTLQVCGWHNKKHAFNICCRQIGASKKSNLFPWHSSDTLGEFSTERVWSIIQYLSSLTDASILCYSSGRTTLLQEPSLPAPSNNSNCGSVNLKFKGPTAIYLHVIFRLHAINLPTPPVVRSYIGKR